jgi:adenylate kinase
MSGFTKTEHKFKAFLIMGAPGSGKGTQGKVLGSIPRFHHLACGDVFRGMDTRTPIGQKFMEYSSRGELVPDDLTITMWRLNIKQRVEAHQFKPDIDFLVLDGIPRNVEQAQLLEHDIEVLKVFHLSCPDRSELFRRLRKRAIKDNRLDDASDVVIANRLQTYEEETKPILEYYGADRVQDVDASQSPAKVMYDILGGVMKLSAWHDLEKRKV